MARKKKQNTQQLSHRNYLQFTDTRCVCQKCIGEKSQWKWLGSSCGLSFSILTQGVTVGLSGEAGVAWGGSREALVGVLRARRWDGCKVDTGGRTLAPVTAAATLLLVLVAVAAVCVSVCGGHCGFVCDGPCSPSVKKEGREAEEDG